MIRRCGGGDLPAMLAIINDAAQAYRGVIPADRWHDPYMPESELAAEIAAGVTFWGAEEEGRLAGVMGLQDVRGVALIRHAYVATARRGGGIGSQLLRHIATLADRPLLVGTWADASWAIRFYVKHGFTLLSPAEKDRLLRTYWDIPDRQIATSVVLADERWRARLTDAAVG
jgi:GNAT superfamily N-acetyltransferase